VNSSCFCQRLHILRVSCCKFRLNNSEDLDMELSIYIKKRLFGDIVLLLIVSGTMYLIVHTWNKITVPDEPTVEMISIGDNSDSELG